MTQTHDVVIEVRFRRAVGDTIEDAVLRAGERLLNAGFHAEAGVYDGMRATLTRDHEREREEAMADPPADVEEMQMPFPPSR
jgi:hypothetical protein